MTCSNNLTLKVLIVSLLVGVLQFVYNLLMSDAEVIRVLPTLFEGTFMFIIIAFLFMFLFKKDIFKEWIIFAIALSAIHSLFIFISLGLNWNYLFVLFIVKLLIVIVSIKFIDYVIKD
jgi:hypothetical protein